MLIMEDKDVLNEMIHIMARDLTTDYHGESWVINHYFQKAYKKLEKENDKMKVMISLPMNGVPDEEVERKMNEIKKLFAKLHIDVVDSFITDECMPETYTPGVYYLGRTLKKFMCNVDAVYFADGWEKARGCRIERKICEEYDIKILDKTFFESNGQTLIRGSFENTLNKLENYVK